MAISQSTSNARREAWLLDRSKARSSLLVIPIILGVHGTAHVTAVIYCARTYICTKLINGQKSWVFS